METLSPRDCQNSCPLRQWSCPIISSSAIPFSLCPQSFPASESFPIIQFFASSGLRTGALASTSVLPMNIQGCFPLELTDLISLQSKGLSAVLYSTQFESINYLALSLLYGPTLTSINDYWKNHTFDNMDLCQQSDIYPTDLQSYVHSKPAQRCLSPKLGGNQDFYP